MSLINSVDFRLLVSLGGGIYCGQDHGVVYFKAKPSGDTLRLFAFAVKSPDDIRLAIKAHEEKLRETHAWEQVTANERG
jgi:hypothetical protein